MKQVVIIGPAHPLRGGIAAYTQRMAKQFADEGYQVSVFTFSLQYPSFLFPGKTQYSNDPAPEGLNIYKKINSVNPFNWVKTGNEIKKLNAEMVIFCFWIPFMAPCYGVMARIIRKNKISRITGVIHNMLPHEERAGDKILSRYFIKACDGFITMTRKVDDDLHQLLPAAHSLIIPHPVYDNYGQAVAKQVAADFLGLADGKYILFFGLIRKYKGLDLLIQALSDKRLEDVNLLVAGEFYDDRKYYDEIIRSLNIYNRITIHSKFIPDNEVKYYFSIADLVILPYRNATQSGVGSLALHFDKPMIVSNFGGLPEMVVQGKTGFIVEDNPASVADAIHQFYSLPGNEMIEAVKKEKLKYSWSAVVRGILQLYSVK